MGYQDSKMNFCLDLQCSVLYFGCIPSENTMSNADMCTLIQCHFKFPNVTTDTALYYSINYISLFGSEISVKNIIIVSVYSVPTTLQYVQYLLSKIFEFHFLYYSITYRFLFHIQKRFCQFL